jgi:uncharacterized membrane protein
MSDWNRDATNRQAALAAQRESSGRTNEHEFRRAFGMGLIALILCTILLNLTIENAAHESGGVIPVVVIGALIVGFIARESRMYWPLWLYFLSMVAVAALGVGYSLFVVR